MMSATFSPLPLHPGLASHSPSNHLLSTTKDMDRSSELRNLALKFADVAQRVGVIIIKELFIKDDRLKTVLPIAKGIAGPSLLTI